MLEKAQKMKDQIDSLVLATRRTSGKRTETSVVRIWKRWVPLAIERGDIADEIVDAHHMCQYLLYTASRPQLGRSGAAATSSDKLSASTLKKTMTMLGRIRRCQYDDNPALMQVRPAEST
ncbi:unnamed protein product [Somion occarium]|uniref:Uncharacterized protein n=1 Tax=Somion occarium TaxID=3059160 RepID=A0ABP1DYS7_9APHY